MELSSQDINNWVITDEYFSSNVGIQHVYIRQTHNNIEVYNAVANFNMKDGSVFSMGNRLESNIASRVNTSQAVITQKYAIEAAAKELGIKFSQSLQLEEVVDNNKSIFSAADISLEKIPVKLMYQPCPDGKIRLVWDLSIYQLDKKHWWSVRVDAQTAKILDKVDWVVSCTFENCGHNWHNTTRRPIPSTVSEELPPPNTDQYRVYALPLESPSHGPRSLVVGPYNILASPYGWHDTNGAAGAEYTTTRGNNVNAMEDADGNNGTGYSPTGGASLNFDFPVNFNQAPVNYRDAAITNLFYMNNIMHDIWYQYGFNEVGGNFQENNYGRGGTANDGVIADAQDGSGTNNANFATPADGTRPRMQMYLWTNPLTYLLTVNSPTAVAGQYVATEAGFGPAVPATPITANLVLMTDATTDFYDGCDALTNAAAISGKIAVVRRGTCNFVTKVQAAQNAGALAVIVVNNAAGAPIAMGGTSTTINIPSIMVSQADGDPLITALLAGTTINATLQNPGGPFDLDGDFDNGVVAHEYGHGISTRLTGGPSNSNCLDNEEQMGEGWSDWFGLMLTIEPGDTATDVRGIGTYVTGEPTNGNGIRPAPYSTSLAVNNYTYVATNNAAISMPHGIGFVWCTMLWEMTWDLINQYGFSSNLYTGTAGNNIAMNLVTTALKLQPCNPGFVDGRNAILQADSILYNGANKCLIWRAFARRGLGFSASQGSSASRTDQVEAFDLPSICQVPTAAPDANFGSITTCNGTVYFRDSSTVSPSSWRWSFGDGNSSTVQNPTHIYNASGTYSVKLVSTNAVGSDSTTLSIIVNLPAAPTATNVNICENQTATFNASGSGTITWFDSTGTTQVGTGTTFTTPALTNTRTYRVQSVVQAASQNVGPATAAIGTSANHNQTTIFALNFSTYQPVTIVSVWVNASTTGNRTINIYNGPNGTGTVLTSTTVNITATGAQRITLNLNIPTPGNYSIGGVSMNMLRNNAGVVYPYRLTNVVAITGSSAGAGFYYYYYNWEVRTAACASAKIPVVANINRINNNATVSNATCSAFNGSIASNPSGGTAPYNYLWSNTSSSSTATGLNPGNYTVTITDAIGCTATSSSTVGSQSLSINSSTSVTNASCSVLGTATVNTSNGQAPFQYLWSNGANSQTASGLNAGNYTVTITDANGCTTSNSATVINGTNSINSTLTSVQANCNIPGSATASASNGTAPYTYLWSDGQNSSSANNLSAGVYTVTITDNTGCININSVTISNIGTSVNSSISAVDATCNSSGSASVVATNGVAPYTYLWSDGQNVNTAVNLIPGNYTVSITDANGCIGANVITIVAQAGPSLSVNTLNISCNGLTDGTATANASGGSGSYTYLWSNGQISSQATGLSAGTYSLTVTDANACTAVESISISEPSSLSISSVSNNVSAVGLSDGSIDITVSGANAPYTYSWSNGTNTEDIAGLIAGNYSVTVTDASGCTIVENFTILDAATAISLVSDFNNINLYPNPSNDNAVLELSLNKLTDIEISIVDALGRTLTTTLLEAVNSVQFNIATKDYPSGIYFVRIRSEKEIISKQLSVVRD